MARKYYWYHTKRLALIKAGHLRQNYKDIEIKIVKTRAFGKVYFVYYGDLKR